MVVRIQTSMTHYLPPFSLFDREAVTLLHPKYIKSISLVHTFRDRFLRGVQVRLLSSGGLPALGELNRGQGLKDRRPTSTLIYWEIVEIENHHAVRNVRLFMLLNAGWVFNACKEAFVFRGFDSCRFNGSVRYVVRLAKLGIQFSGWKNTHGLAVVDTKQRRELWSVGFVVRLASL